MDKQRFINKVNTRCEYNKYNHIFVTDVEPESAVVEAELRPESLNPLGMAHGGTIFTLCDIAAGSAAASQGTVAVTLNGFFSLAQTASKICLRNAQRQPVFHAPEQGQKAPLRSANNKARPHRQRR